MRSKFIKSRQAKVGAPPGAMVHVGERMADKTSLRVMTYNAAEVKAWPPRDSVEGIASSLWQGVTWINLDGLHRVDAVTALGREFNLSTLVPWGRSCEVDGLLLEKMPDVT